jgi:hypothetical protein
MNRFMRIAVLLFFIGFFSCSLYNKGKDDVPDSFRQLLKKFQLLKLPLRIREGEIDTKGLTYTVDKNSKSDSLYIDIFCIYYGMLPDTSNYYALVVLTPADNIVPSLIIFDKKGEKISEEALTVRGCGGGPGIDCHLPTTIINNDLTIFCADTIKSVLIDNNGKPIDSTLKYYCEYKTGKINSTGKITLTEEKTKILK